MDKSFIPRSTQPVPANPAATTDRAGNRVCKIDPAVYGRIETATLREFTAALQAYKHASGRTFPTWSEARGVLKSLGYERPGEDLPIMNAS